MVTLLSPTSFFPPGKQKKIYRSLARATPQSSVPHLYNTATSCSYKQRWQQNQKTSDIPGIPVTTGVKSHTHTFLLRSHSQKGQNGPLPLGFGLGTFPRPPDCAVPWQKEEGRVTGCSQSPSYNSAHSHLSPQTFRGLAQPPRKEAILAAS